jgi:tetratricopeptide (TPR) repeat protein
MAEAGPSKEELEYYYKNSRQYFDELARHYYTADREYYDKYIAPFYGPFAGITPSGTPSGARPALLTIAILIAILTAGIAFFLISFQQGTKDTETKKVEETGEPEREQDTKTSDKYQIEYEKGLKYFSKGDYTNAERYFKRIPKSDRNYDNAQKKLKEIEEIRKETTPDKKPDSRNPRSQPMERTR